MASTSEWLAGARPRTLPAAVSPVLAGTGVAIHADSFVWWRALLALVVALSLQIGVNYANDYSDGIRGTDDARVGPLRLVASGVATGSQVKTAAFVAFAVACVSGLVLAATTSWWLLAVGAAAIVAAWFYTGGTRPYGYRGLGELSVFVFFGLVAVIGTAWVQTQQISDGVVLAGCAIGALACAILVANNLRDIPTDRVADKRTLAVVLGDQRSRRLFTVLHGAAYVLAIAIAVTTTWWALLALAALPLTWRAVAAVRSGAVGPALIAVLKSTGLAELAFAAGLFAGYLIDSLG